jgi:Insulinase (Peptidase family M16)
LFCAAQKTSVSPSAVDDYHPKATNQWNCEYIFQMTTLKFAIRGGSRAETLSEKGAEFTWFLHLHFFRLMLPLIVITNYLNFSSRHFLRLWIRLLEILHHRHCYILSSSPPNLLILVGAAHMLSITAFAGTQRVSGLRLIRDLETMGAQIASSADREKVSTFFLSTQTDQYSSFYINLITDKEKSILLSV